jgi:hypothetical protein
MSDLPATWNHRYQRAMDLHEEWNRTHRVGAPQNVSADIAKKAGFESGSGLLPLFRHGYLVTRSDGRWVDGLQIVEEAGECAKQSPSGRRSR